MISDNIKVENMSHVTASFPIREKDTNEDIPDNDIHPTQLGKRRIKLEIYFIVPGEEPNPGIPRIAKVRVPRGVPVAKLRPLIRHCEAALQDIYGRSKRLNFVMTCDDDSNEWVYEFDLPVFGVVYV